MSQSPTLVLVLSTAYMRRPIYFMSLWRTFTWILTSSPGTYSDVWVAPEDVYVVANTL